MGIAERFTTAPQKYAVCKMGRVLALLDAADRAAVEAAMTGPTAYEAEGGWSDRSIAKALTDEGHPISDSAVRDHRLHDCCCK